MNYKNALLLLGLLWLCVNPTWVKADLYLWVDEEGVTRVTNKKPDPGAEVRMHLDEYDENSQIPVYFPRRAPGANNAQHPYVDPNKAKHSVSRYLHRMEEPVLYGSNAGGGAIFRLLILPSFHHPMCIRINVKPDGTATLAFKETNGSGGNLPGELIKNETIHLALNQRQQFLDVINRCEFWKLHSSKHRGLDGAVWIIEGINARTYHFVSAWSPREGSCIGDIGRLMLSLANIKDN